MIESEKIKDLLEIEKWSEIEYVEQFLDLMEVLYDIEVYLCKEIFGNMDGILLKELIESYFTDLYQGMFDEQYELFKVFKSVKLSLLDLLNEMDEVEDPAVSYGEMAFELNRLSRWLMVDSKVLCKDLKLKEDVKTISVYEALILKRIENLKEGSYEFQFINNYEINPKYLDAIMNPEFEEECFGEADEVDEGFIDRYDPVIDNLEEQEL